MQFYLYIPLKKTAVNPLVLPYESYERATMLLDQLKTQNIEVEVVDREDHELKKKVKAQQSKRAFKSNYTERVDRPNDIEANQNQP